MTYIFISVFLLVSSGLYSLLANKDSDAARSAGCIGAVLAGMLGVASAVSVLLGRVFPPVSVPCNIPFCTLAFDIDYLSAFFLLIISSVSALSAIYSYGYFNSYPNRKIIGASWLFFNVLTASMLLLVVARNAVLFLIAWETMALSSFFLVIFDDKQKGIGKVGWLYLVSTQLGTTFLLVMFIMSALHTGSMDFDSFARLASCAPEITGTLFVLSLIGFGAKAGFVPFHVWLPEAHPAAPSHVSALMSGVMIKTGIYGILRMAIYLGTPAEWWGWLLILLGVISAVYGILFALAQHDIKRLLAYSSIENIGIILIGIGIGFIGLSAGRPGIVAAGFAGALFHLMNHSVMKSLLFMAAGSIMHGTHTKLIDRLGGLLVKMPVTGLCFLIGAAAISGLPPFNGFLGEFLIYFGGFRIISSGGVSPVPGILVLTGMALAGGLALAAFTKAFGIIFLGLPRTESSETAHESCKLMLIPMGILAALCVLIPLMLPFVSRIIANIVSDAAPSRNLVNVAGVYDSFFGPVYVVVISLILVFVGAALWFARKKLLEDKDNGVAGTWDCGYSAPEASMQYTGASFVRPLLYVFGLLGREYSYDRPKGYFPKKARFESNAKDFFLERVYIPLFSRGNSFLDRFSAIQHGNTHLYILYIFLTLIILLMFNAEWL